MNRIPVCEPFLDGNELKYVSECITTGWISSSGKFLAAFENELAKYCGTRYAVGVCNGTVAIHLALSAAGIGKGDEVIIPDFTMIATAFAVCYTGAVPVFVDAEKDTWNIDVNKIEEKISSRTKAILPVSIFGHPCEMDTIIKIASKYNLIVIEDAAESIGAEYNGIKTGNLADITTFSFYANKNITTGEGGAIVTNDEEYFKRGLYYKNLCFPPDSPRTYKHQDIGFNYRMSNIHAAIGLAQLERADYYRDLRIKNHKLYKHFLRDVPGITFQVTMNKVLNVNWMNSILVDMKHYGRSREELIEYLRVNGIETRLLFKGMHSQPSLLRYGCDSTGHYPVTEYLAETGFYLPSASNLKEDQIKMICNLIKEFRKI